MMKKIYTFMALLLVSGVIFAQAQRAGNTFSAVKSANVMNNMGADTKAIIDSLHWDGNNASAIGTNATASTFSVFAFFPSTQLAPLNALGNTIPSVKVCFGDVSTVTSAELKIYSDQGLTLVYNQVFIPVTGWNTVSLTTALPIPTTDLYIGYEIVTTGGYPAGCDAGPANPNGNWINMGTWGHLTDLSPTLIGNWNIRAMVDGTAPTTPTASCNPLSWNAGSVVTTTSSTSGTFTLTNVAGGTLTCSSITGVSAPFTCSLVPASINLAGGASTTFTFTYAPTVIGTNSQTAVINTNGGNISITLTGTGITCGTINTFPWVESFEGATFAPACWVSESPDGGTGWASITAGTTPLPGWNGGTMTVPTGGGNAAAYATWSTGGASANDQWLITPQIAIQTSQELSFYVFFNGGYMDYLDVKVSTTTNTAASFTTTLLATDTLQYIANDWVKFTIPLTAYAGQNVYFAFNEHVADNVNDGAFIGLDLITIDAASGINESTENMISVYPNPVNNILNINTPSAIGKVKIINAVGQVVFENNIDASTYSVNTNNFETGVYVLQIENETGVSMKKIIISR